MQSYERLGAARMHPLGARASSPSVWFYGDAAQPVLARGGDGQADYVHGGVGRVEGKEGGKEGDEGDRWRQKGRDGERGRAGRLHFLLHAPLHALARAPPRVQPHIFLQRSPDGPLRVNAGMLDLSCHVCDGGAGPPSGSS